MFSSSLLGERERGEPLSLFGLSEPPPIIRWYTTLKSQSAPIIMNETRGPVFVVFFLFLWAFYTHEKSFSTCNEFYDVGGREDDHHHRPAVAILRAERPSSAHLCATAAKVMTFQPCNTHQSNEGESVLPRPPGCLLLLCSCSASLL